ncbi:hypothetical protein A1QK_05870 [Vibrio genomosp. F10 str. 9ZD137]|nr:hypothetical protein A1QK_05870 [Vibrio genomosp. F10 str. 9ZD137]
MHNDILTSINQFEFYNSSLYGRPLRAHLKQSYLLCKKLGCSDMECIVALYHSFYGELFGYESSGHPYADRATLQLLIGPKIEELVYLYNIIQAKQGLYDVVSEDKKSHLFWFESLIGKVGITSNQRKILVNVSATETLEQVNYLVNVTKQYSIEKVAPHIEKLGQYLELLHPKVQQELATATKRISYVT